jgi:protein-L-isoaspartate(D-aspartate) O-methyltransferase
MNRAPERRRMVERQLIARGIHDRRVLDAMGAIPREMFVPADEAHLVYTDSPITIGAGQTISQPYMTALMSQSLELKGNEVVLDIGTGSGYHAAVLGTLAWRVYSIEVIPELAQQARRNLEAAGLGSNILVITGDGSKGYPEAMPFDAISVAAAAPDIPRALIEQLRDPGRLVIPVGSREEQTLLLITKSNGQILDRTVTGCRFVPLVGEQGWR